ncbi:52 kDa repressor of the inhibitor of the protein kinase-like, partial [Aphis craccivora]
MTCCIKRPHEISKVTFGIPKDEEEKKWEVALGVVFKKSNRVCSNHFYKEDINSVWTSGSTNPLT